MISFLVEQLYSCIDFFIWTASLNLLKPAQRKNERDRSRKKRIFTQDPLRNAKELFTCFSQVPYNMKNALFMSASWQNPDPAMKLEETIVTFQPTHYKSNLHLCFQSLNLIQEEKNIIVVFLNNLPCSHLDAQFKRFVTPCMC